MKRYIISGSMVLILLSPLYSYTKEKPQHAAATRSVQLELLMGLIPAQNVFHQLEHYAVLKQYFADRPGLMIIPTTLSSYGNIIGRFSSEKLDGALPGIFTYTLAHHQSGAEPITRPVNIDRTSNYRVHLLTCRDGGILVASKGFPENCFAVRKEFDLKLKTALKQALLAMGEG